MIEVFVTRRGPLLTGDPAAVVTEAADKRKKSGAKAYRDSARTRAPRDSGTLASQIEAEDSTVKAQARHAPFVEFGYRRGSTKVQGRQFFYLPENERAAEDELKQIPEDIVRELG